MKKIRKKDPVIFIDVNKDKVSHNKSSVTVEDYSFVDKKRIKKNSFTNEINLMVISVTFIILSGILSGLQIHQSLLQIHQNFQAKHALNLELSQQSFSHTNNQIVPMKQESPYLLPNEVDSYLSTIKKDTQLIRDTLQKYNPDDKSVQNLKLDSKPIYDKYQKLLLSANLNKNFNYYSLEQHTEILNTLKFIVDNYNIVSQPEIDTSLVKKNN